MPPSRPDHHRQVLVAGSGAFTRAGILERLDAILSAPGLTTEQAIAAMDAQFRENQATFPHAIEVTAMASAAPGGERTIPVISYVGPFTDKRAAEGWGTRFNDLPHLSWRTVKMETPEQFESASRRLRSIVEPEDK